MDIYEKEQRWEAREISKEQKIKWDRKINTMKEKSENFEWVNLNFKFQMVKSCRESEMIVE